MFEPKFGRRIPEDRSYERKYAFDGLPFGITPSVERVFRVPALRGWYSQQGNSCTGYSASWLMSILNRPLITRPDERPVYQKYAAYWLYTQARLHDGDPATDPPNDLGSFVWAAFWALNHIGHVKVNARNIAEEPDIHDGLSGYYWCKTPDEMRTVFSLGRLCVVGIDWFNSMSTPDDGWICNKRGWQDRLLGGHAICVYGASDKRQAFKLVNTWGSRYPDVWIPYDSIRWLLNNGGECCAAIDNPAIT